MRLWFSDWKHGAEISHTQLDSIIHVQPLHWRQCWQVEEFGAKAACCLVRSSRVLLKQWGDDQRTSRKRVLHELHSTDGKRLCVWSQLLQLYNTAPTSLQTGCSHLPLKQSLYLIYFPAILSHTIRLLTLWFRCICYIISSELWELCE